MQFTVSLKLRMALLCIMCLVLLVAPTRADEKIHPNIVLIFIDDMGFSDLSCYGNPDVETTHIDRLAGEGIRLTQFYTNSPICSPSRVAVTTGQYPGRHRIHSFLAGRDTNRTRLSRDWLDSRAPCIARAFRQVGYVTAHFGKWHMGGGRDVGDAPLPQAYGWDESLVAFEGLGDRILKTGKDMSSAKLGRGSITWVKKHQKTETYVDRSIQFIRATRAARKPFYLHLWLNDVHTGYHPSASQRQRVAKLDVHPFLKGLYAVMLAMDEQVGRLVREIDDLGLGPDTLIVLTSDNGPNLPRPNQQHPAPHSRTGPYRGEKWSLYEGGIRMPFIARWPGQIPAGREDHESTLAAIDLFPTFCSMAKIPLPDAELDGIDLSAVLRGTASQGREKPVMWEYGRQDIDFLRPRHRANRSPNLAIRDGAWKLLVNEDGSDVQLFDFCVATNEQQNLAHQYPEVTSRLQRQVLDWYASLPSIQELNNEYD